MKLPTKMQVNHAISEELATLARVKCGMPLVDIKAILRDDGMNGLRNYVADVHNWVEPYRSDRMTEIHMTAANIKKTLPQAQSFPRDAFTPALVEGATVGVDVSSDGRGGFDVTHAFEGGKFLGEVDGTFLKEGV